MCKLSWKLNVKKPTLHIIPYSIWCVVNVRMIMDTVFWSKNVKAALFSSFVVSVLQAVQVRCCGALLPPVDQSTNVTPDARFVFHVCAHVHVSSLHDDSILQP